MIIELDFSYSEMKSILEKESYIIESVTCYSYYSKNAQVEVCYKLGQKGEIPDMIINHKKENYNDLNSCFNITTVFRKVLKEKILNLF